MFLPSLMKLEFGKVLPCLISAAPQVVSNLLKMESFSLFSLNFERKIELAKSLTFSFCWKKMPVTFGFKLTIY